MTADGAGGLQDRYSVRTALKPPGGWLRCALRSPAGWVASVVPVSDADDDAAVGFAVDVAGSVLRVAFRGELDLACAEVFDCLFDLETDGIDSVVLDLGALTFCDVSGANALAGLRAFHLCQGRRCRFSAVQPQVRRVMALTEQQAGPARDGAAPA